MQLTKLIFPKTHLFVFLNAHLFVLWIMKISDSELRGDFLRSRSSLLHAAAPQSRQGQPDMQSSRAPSERDRTPRNALLFLVRCKTGTVRRPAPPLTAVPRSRHPLPARSDLHTTDRNSSTGGFPHHPTPILHPVRTAPTAADRRRLLPHLLEKHIRAILSGSPV